MSPCTYDKRSQGNGSPVNVFRATETDERFSRKAPLTEEEKTLEDVRQAEAEASQGTSARSSHIKHGLNFPVSQEATTALSNLMESDENLVQLVYMYLLQHGISSS